MHNCSTYIAVVMRTSQSPQGIREAITLALAKCPLSLLLLHLSHVGLTPLIQAVFFSPEMCMINSLSHRILKSYGAFFTGKTVYTNYGKQCLQNWSRSTAQLLI